MNVSSFDEVLETAHLPRPASVFPCRLVSYVVSKHDTLEKLHADTGVVNDTGVSPDPALLASLQWTENAIAVTPRPPQLHQ